MNQRLFQRSRLEYRPLKFITPCNAYAEGSCLIHMGQTQVHCTVSIDEKVPKHVSTGGWITAEYAMLPRATHTRGGRDRAPMAPNSRGSEIQRLIGRSLRGMVDLSILGTRTLTVDCDVIQADGGTRCASINGSAVALMMAVHQLIQEGKLTKSPIRSVVGAVSVVLRHGEILIDPDYAEDSSADMDMNVVMNAEGNIIEMQASAERYPPDRDTLQAMIHEAQKAIVMIINQMPKTPSAL